MAKQVSKTVIGGFVISGIALLVAGVIVFGSGTMFKKTNKYVMFFEESVKGLSPGAPVVWRGVQIGSVKSIVLNVLTKREEINIPVVIEVDRSRMNIVGEASPDIRQNLNKLIDLGWRAQLSMQSFVTGKQMIELELLPESPVRLTRQEPQFPEIPTVKSNMGQLSKKLQDLPLEEIGQKLLSSLDGVDKLLKDPEIKDSIHSLHDAGENLNRLIRNVDRVVADTGEKINMLGVDMDRAVNTLSEDGRAALSEVQVLLKGVREDFRDVSGQAGILLKNANGQVQPLSERIQETLNGVKKSLEQANITLATANDFVGYDSDTRHKLNASLDYISAAALSMKSLVDYLERHPEALLQGKGGR